MKNINQVFVGIDARQLAAGDQRLEHGNIVCAFFRPAEHPVLSAHRDATKATFNNSPLARNVQVLTVSPELKPYKVGLCVLEKKLKNPLIAAFWHQLSEKPGLLITE